MQAVGCSVQYLMARNCWRCSEIYEICWDIYRKRWRFIGVMEKNMETTGLRSSLRELLYQGLGGARMLNNFHLVVGLRRSSDAPFVIADQSPTSFNTNAVGIPRELPSPRLLCLRRIFVVAI